MSRLGSMVVRLALDMMGYKADLDKAAVATTEASKKIEDSVKRTGDAVKSSTREMQGEAGELIKKLQQQAETFNMTSAELRRYHANNTLATESQRELINATLSNIEALEAQKAASMGGTSALSGLSRGALIAGGTIAALAAVTGLVAYAAYKGSAEQKEYQKALILTGNASGTYAGQMQTMAASIDKVVGTQYEAASALTAMASTGQVARENLQGFSQTAVQMEKVLGQSVGDTAKTFAELGQEPVKASLKLNESMNYLTASTYAQIKAAQELGDTDRAGSIAQNAFADAMNSRIEQLKANMGTLERAWISVKGVAKETWDAMLGLGREETTAEKIAKITKQLENYENSKKSGSRLASISDGEARILREQLTSLAMLETRTRDVAAAEADRAKTQKDGIAGMEAVDRLTASTLTKRQQLVKSMVDYHVELEKIRAVTPDDPRLDPKKIAETERALRKRYQEEAHGLTDVQKGVALYNDLISESAGYSGDYAEKVQLLAKAYVANHWSVKQLSQAMDVLNAKQPLSIAAAKEHEAQTKAGVKAYEDYLKSQEKVLKGYQDSADSVEKQVLKLETEEKASVIAAAQAISLAQAIAQVELARLRERQSQELANSASGDTLLALQREIAAREKMIGLIERKDSRQELVDEEKKIADERKKGWEETDRLARGIFVDWAKDGSNAAKKIGDALETALLSAIYEASIKPIAFQIYTSVAGDGSTSVSGTGGAGGSNTLGQIAGASSIVSAMNTGFAAFGAKVGSAFNSFAMSSTGTSLGLSQTSYAGNAVLAGGPEAVAAKSMTASAQSMSATASSMASIAAGALAGVGVGSAIGGDHKLQGMNSTEMSAVGAAAGAYIGSIIPGLGTAVGAFVGGVAGGVLDRAFGGTDAKLNEQGLRGTFNASTGADAGGYYITQQSRGWFGGDGIEGTGKNGGYTKDAALTAYLNTGIFAVTTSVKEYAKVIGLSADAVDGFSKKIDVSIKDLSPADQQKKIADTIGSFGDDMVQAVYGDMLQSLAKYDASGALETSTQTLTRLGKDITAVNSVFEVLGYTVQETSLKGAAAASKIVDAFGGLDKFAGSLDGYYKNFYSTAEQHSAGAASIAKALGMAGGSFTADQIGSMSREAYRALVDATQASLGADSPLYVALIQQSDAFAQIVPKADDATDAIRNLGTALTDEVKRIRGIAAGTGAMGYAQAQSAFAIATAQARAGNQDAAKALPELSRSLLDLAKANTTTAVDLARVRIATANSLEATASVLGVPIAPTSLFGSAPSLAIAPPPAAVGASASATDPIGAATLTVLKDLLQKIISMEENTAANVTHTASIANRFKRVTPDGDAVQMRAV